jgi:hypothetical protein
MFSFRQPVHSASAQAKFALILSFACLFCTATAYGQQTAERPHSKLNLNAPLTLLPRIPASKEPRPQRPATPSQTTPFPSLPDKQGCYRTVDDKWVEVPCATDAQKAAHAGVKPMPANSITSTQHAGPMYGPLPFHHSTVTEPFTWGSITVSQPNPVAGSETDSTGEPNSFSIQVNPFYFTCTTCTAGSPFPLSQPNDGAWVQFVYQQFGSSATKGTQDTNLCVWEFDTAVLADTYSYSTGQSTSGVYSKCINPSMTDSVLPVDGAGAPTGAAEVVGYIKCPSSGTGQCTLWAVAHLPWSPSSKWWSVSTPDLMGLNGNWINVSGGLFGAGNGSQAVLTNTQLQTTVEAYTCFANPNPANVGGPAGCTVPPKWEAWSIYFDLTAAAGTVTPTGETNNLTPGSATMTCGYYDCVLGYTSQ